MDGPYSDAMDAVAEAPRRSIGESARRIGIQAILIAHATAATLWWWRQPAGFAFSDPHFWVNTILPWVVVAAALAARFPRGRYGGTLRQSILLGIPLIWIAAGVSAKFTFPVTFGSLWLFPVFAGGAMLILAMYELRRPVHYSLLVSTIAAIGIGAALPISQRAPAPSTLPLNSALPSIPANTEAIRSAARVPIAPDLFADIVDGGVRYESGRYVLLLNPMLSFTSRSPDGCWVLFALPQERDGVERVLQAMHSAPSGLDLLYADDDRSTLQIRNDDSRRTVEVEAASRVPKPIWSHLNSFTEWIVTGHRRLFVTFSPCPEARIEVVPMDYPVGRPERFACLGDNDEFGVFEGANAEKGPFKPLARGKLGRNQPLIITLYDEEVMMYRLTFDDFAAQASVQASPTAGWRAPANAIEFRREGEDPSAPAAFFLTLAATSVGSGYDSVGHAAGTYRNRLHIHAPATQPTTTLNR